MTQKEITRDLWQAGGASVIGASHLRNDLPNQDAHLAFPADAKAQRAVLAVSDGHGSAPSFRSDIGARFAVEAACEVLDWFLDDPDVFAAGQTLARDIVESWRAKVAADIECNPLPSDKSGSGYLPYGATVIVVGVTPTLLVALQIGDGDLLFGYGDDDFERPLPDDDGLVGEQTYSLCLDNAADFARLYIVEREDALRWPDFIFLSTDGIAKSFQSDRDYISVGGSYRKLAFGDFGSALDNASDWLRDVTTKGSGDDVTMCFAARMQSSAEDISSVSSKGARV